MRQIYDWDSLKQEFIHGHWLNISTFLVEKKLKNNSYSRQKTAGWLALKAEYHQDISEQARDRLVNNEIEIRTRQSRMARSLQLKGLKGLSKMKVETAEEARKLITSGMQEEREALGLNNNKKPIDFNQVNTSLPKTHFDDMIDNLNAEQTLELLVKLREERKRRSNLQLTTT